MENLVYSDSQKDYLIKGVQIQIEAVKKQLKDLEDLISQLNPPVTIQEPLHSDNNETNNISTPVVAKKPVEPNNNGFDYFNKISEVLSVADEPMTSRDILETLYNSFPDKLDKSNDRRNMATLSSILVQKTHSNKIEKLTQDTGHTKFRLIKPSSVEKDQKRVV